jgi:ferritin-like metal-binding protein YciE
MRRAGCRSAGVQPATAPTQIAYIREGIPAASTVIKALRGKPRTVRLLQDPLEQTQRHLQRLDELAKILEITPKGKVCKAMKGLVEEGSEVIEEEGEATIIDLALIGAAQRVEHYEIAAYGTVRALAEALGLDDVAQILQTTLDEEGNTDKLLTGIAEQLTPSAVEAAAE